MTTDSEHPRSARLPRSPSKRGANRADTRARLRAAGVVVLILGGVLVAGAIVHDQAAPAATGLASGELPAVDLTSPVSVEWDCPGPLLAGASGHSSSVIIANPGALTASVEVVVVAEGSTLKSTRAPLYSHINRLPVAPHTQRVVALRTTGPQQYDAVSVLATAGAVAVFESTVPLPAVALSRDRKAREGLRPASSAPQESACSTGTMSDSYLAAGSTAGRSDVLVSLFDPTATQAVATIRVSTSSGVISPPMLQGLIIRPYSVAVFNLARLAVQQATVAIAATTSVGRVVLGAYESTASDSTAATALSGQALLIGVAAPRATWVMTPGLGGPDRTVAINVYDPGSRSASVTISSEATSTAVHGRPMTEISSVVPAGEVREITLPLPNARMASSKTTRHVILLQGPMLVRAAGGVGIVVARSALLQVSAHAQTLAVVAATAGPARDWLLPAASSTNSRSPEQALSGGVVISNPGPARVEVALVELTAGGTPSSRLLRTLVVPAEATETVGLHLPIPAVSFAGLEVNASSPVVAEQDCYALGTPRYVLPIAPVPVEGVPVNR